MTKVNKNRIIFAIIFLSLIVRAIAALIYGDKSLANEWAIIIHNFEISGTFGFNVVISEYLAIPKFAVIGEKVLPSIFMPPLYFYFIYIINFFANDLLDTAEVIIYFQIFLSLISIFIFYKLINIIEKDKFFSTFLTFIFGFFPIYVYASSQISSITLQIFLIIIFLFFLLNYQKEKKIKHLIFFSFISGLLILIRGEFILFYFLTLVYFFKFYKKDYKSIIISLTVTILIISPYLYRNYENFNTLTITKSIGYNLLKGNNPTFKVEGSDEFISKNFSRKNLRIKTNNNYEINLDNFYKKKAITYIKDEPLNYLKFYFIKLGSFVMIDLNSSYPNYYNILHTIPKILISLMSLIGAIIVISKKGFYQFLSIFYFTNIFLFSVFFILPRYSLILIPIQLLLSIEVIKYLRRKLSNNFVNNFFG